MKKILFINSVCGTGSTGRIVSDLYHYLEGCGYECCVAYGRKKLVENRIHTIKIGNPIGVCIHGICSRITDKHGFYSSLETKRLLQKIESYEPDVIHLHNIHGYYLNIKILFEYLKKKNIPIIWTLHDCWAFTGHCAHFDGVGCSKWKSECGACPQKYTYPASFLKDSSRWNYKHKKELFTGLRNLTIVVPSNWLRDQVKSSFLSEYNVEVIRNGIDLSIFRQRESSIREKYGLENRKIILGAANKWSPNKGLKYFIDLAGYLDDSYKIVLVGLSKKQIKGLPSAVLGLERTENAIQMAELYSAADLFFNASIEETMGLVTVEALACGTPVMAFDRTAISETFDKSCGILLRHEGINAVLESIQGNGWRAFSSSACRNYAEKFAKERMYEEYGRIFRQL